MIFNESKFPASTSVLNTRYKHLESQNNNPFYPFNDQVDYALAYYFADSRTTKRNIDKFLTHSLMKPITKNFLYYNSDKWIEKLSTIRWGIPNDKCTKHKFKLESKVDKVARQSLTI